MTLPIMRESKNCKWLVFMAISLVTYLKTVVPSLYKYRLPASSFCQKGAILKEDSSLLCRWIENCHCPKQHSEPVYLLLCECRLRVPYCWDKIKTFCRSYRTNVKIYYCPLPSPSPFSNMWCPAFCWVLYIVDFIRSSQQQYEVWYCPLYWWRKGGWWRLGNLSHS